MNELIKCWTKRMEEEFIKQIMGQPEPFPSYALLDQEIEKLFPEQGIIRCSSFTHGWLIKNMEGLIHQHGFVNENGEAKSIYVFYSRRLDGFEGTYFEIDDSMPPYKVRLKKKCN